MREGKSRFLLVVLKLTIRRKSTGKLEASKLNWGKGLIQILNTQILNVYTRFFAISADKA